MRALMPWTGMTSSRKEMDRPFDRLLEPMLAEWEPTLDISENKDGVITVTLPEAPEAKGTTIPVKAA